jgi:hypothetical protein
MLNDTASTLGLAVAAEPIPNQITDLEFDKLRFSLSDAGWFCFMQPELRVQPYRNWVKSELYTCTLFLLRRYAYLLKQPSEIAGFISVNPQHVSIRMRDLKLLRHPCQTARQRPLGPLSTLGHGPQAVQRVRASRRIDRRHDP